MASRTAYCGYCGAPFVGYGKTSVEALIDANNYAEHHALTCVSNTANQD